MEHKLTFEWTNGNSSAADNMIQIFKAAGIRWQYNPCSNLQAALNGSDFVNVEYYKISGNTYGITEKPVCASKYFGIPSAALYRLHPDEYGFYPEELKALDRTEEPGRFLACNLCSALELADEYSRAGYETVDIVESLQNYGSYFVLCRDYNPSSRAR